MNRMSDHIVVIAAILCAFLIFKYLRPIGYHIGYEPFVKETVCGMVKGEYLKEGACVK